MAGKIQSYETPKVRKGPKNTLLGVRSIPLLMWQVTDRKGVITTALGFEVEPGQIRRFPMELSKKSLPVGDKLQKLLLEQLHPELVEANEGGPTAAPPGRIPKAVAAARMPKDIDVGVSGG